MTQHKRPISPHLQVYKPQITSVLSIFHRITGQALNVGLLFLAWFLVELAFGSLENSLFATLMFSPIGIFMLFGWTYCIAYHMCTGIRHLFWDAGYGYDLDTVTKTGWLAIGASLVLTLVAWVCVASKVGWI